MVGIAAGIAKSEMEEQMYGDVIVPDVVWNYSAGKFVNPEKAKITYGNLGFLPRSTSENIPEEIVPYLQAAIDSPDNPCHAYISLSMIAVILPLYIKETEVLSAVSA